MVHSHRNALLVLVTFFQKLGTCTEQTSSYHNNSCRTISSFNILGFGKFYQLHIQSKKSPDQTVHDSHSPVTFCLLQSITCHLLHSTCDLTRSPIASKGAGHLLPTTPAVLPTATKHFDRAESMIVDDSQ